MYYRDLTRLGLAGYVFIGTAAVLIPTVMPAITAEFQAMGLSLAVIGLIFPAQAIGRMGGDFLAGMAADVLGRARMVWLAALMLAAMLGLAALAQIWSLFVLGFVLLSVAQAALATSINAMVADSNPQARARMLNLLHGLYGAGAAVSPLLIGYLIDQGLGWRWALGGTAVIWLGYGLVALRFDRGMTQAGVSPARAPGLNFNLLTVPAILVLFVIAFVYNGVAFSLLGWVAVFLEGAGFSTFFSVAMVAVFYLALTLGRFACAVFAEALGYGRTLLLLAGGITLSYPLILLEPQPALVVVSTFLIGLSLSGLFPTAMAYGARLYPQHTGTLSGTLNVGMALGAMVPPFWTGLVADQAGFQTALAFNYLLILPLGILAWYLRRLEHKSDALPQG